MGTLGRFLNKIGDEIAPKKTETAPSNQFSVPASNSASESIVNRKESAMLKFGTHDEKEVGFDQQSGNATGKSNIGTSTLIGEHIAIEGIIRANEDIVIEGTIKGTIEAKSHQLTVGSKGKVEADVEAENVVISGRMVGNVMARGKVQITKSADFNGQIKAKRIAVEDGAYIKASIELERDAKEQPSSHKPIEAIVLGADPSKSAKVEFPKPQTVK
jgi:cytoskeletal protein CcmA (bactofilin family)